MIRVSIVLSKHCSYVYNKNVMHFVLVPIYFCQFLIPIFVPWAHFSEFPYAQSQSYFLTGLCSYLLPGQLCEGLILSILVNLIPVSLCIYNLTFSN